MNLILIGMPMSGKSYFGEKVAKSLGWELIDTDRLIEKLIEKTTGGVVSCRQVMLNEGEKAFRAWEKMAILSLRGEKEKVIATGGGVLFCPENRSHLKKMGVLIYLKTPVSTLIERLANKRTIPSYLDPQAPEYSLEKLEKQRIEIYESSADFIIDTGPEKEEEIINAIILKKLGNEYG